MKNLLEDIKTRKPLGRKSYGSIPHLPESRLGSSDSKISDGQAFIATEKCRKGEVVIVQEKLDGSNVCIANINNKIYALTRKGYLASTSPFDMHHLFDQWVIANTERLLSVINDGERLCGEWLTQAHGTIYNLPHEPFVAFDIIDGNNKQTRMCYDDFKKRINGKFVLPFLIHKGCAMSVKEALLLLGKHGKHGAIDEVEGAVWRVESDNKVNFLCKFVKIDKVDGKYLGDNTPNKYK